MSVQNRGGDTIRPACCPAQATFHVWSDVRLHTTEERIGARRRTRFPLRNFSKKKILCGRSWRAGPTGKWAQEIPLGFRAPLHRNEERRKEGKPLAGWLAPGPGWAGTGGRGAGRCRAGRSRSARQSTGDFSSQASSNGSP